MTQAEWEKAALSERLFNAESMRLWLCLTIVLVFCGLALTRKVIVVTGYFPSCNTSSMHVSHCGCRKNFSRGYSPHPEQMTNILIIKTHYNYVSRIMERWGTWTARNLT